MDDEDLPPVQPESNASAGSLGRVIGPRRNVRRKREDEALLMMIL